MVPYINDFLLMMIVTIRLACAFAAGALDAPLPDKPAIALALRTVRPDEISCSRVIEFPPTSRAAKPGVDFDI